MAVRKHKFPIGRVSFAHTVPTGTATGGHDVTVTAWYSDVYGLVISESLPSNMAGKWTVSHTRSGYAIGYADTWRDALTLADRLGECGSWNRDIDDIKADRPFRVKTSAVVREHGQQAYKRPAASVWG